MTALRRAAALLLATLSAVRAAAEAAPAFAPMRKLADGSAAPAGDGVTLWLAVASVAMIATLWAAHWSIFRRK